MPTYHIPQRPSATFVKHVNRFNCITGSTTLNASTLIIKQCASIRRLFLDQGLVEPANRQKQPNLIPAEAARERVKTTHAENESSLLLPSIGIVAMRVGCAALSLAAGVIVARHLGRHGYGVYSWALTMMNLMVVPSQLGLPYLVVRETVRAHETQSWSLMKGLWLWASGVVVLSTTFTVMVVLSVGWHLADAGHFTTLVLAAVLMAFMVMGNIRVAALRGLHHDVLGQLPEYVIKPVVNLSILLVFPLATTHIQLTPPLAMWVQCIAAFTSFLFGAVMLWRLSPKEIYQCGKTDFSCGQWMGSAIRMMITSLLAVANQSVSVLMLSALAGESDTGVYAAIAGLAAITSFGLQAVSLAVGPQLARLHTRGDRNALQSLVRKNSRATIAFALPVTMFLMFFGAPTLGFLYGAEFVEGALGLAILGGGQLVSANAGAVGLLLLMTGHEKDAAKSMAIATVVNVIVSVILVPRLGVTGAAISVAVSLVIWSSSMWWYVRERLHIETCGILSLFKMSRVE